MDGVVFRLLFFSILYLFISGLVMVLGRVRVGGCFEVGDIGSY